MVVPEVEEIGVANRTPDSTRSTQLVNVVPIQINGNLSVLQGQVDINGTAVTLHETAPAANVSEDAVILAAAREAQRAKKGAARRPREPDTALLWGWLPEQLAHTLNGYGTHSLLLYRHAAYWQTRPPVSPDDERILLKWLLYLATAVKFTFFITIELGVFPTFRGMLIDFCTLPVSA
ncbi:hypothetical protein HK101_004652 [Irineochytrium annulatum]|nr:hypothetical protein HK101_004652 [Irineochytrium annulatum]